MYLRADSGRGFVLSLFRISPDAFLALPRSAEVPWTRSAGVSEDLGRNAFRNPELVIKEVFCMAPSSIYPLFLFFVFFTTGSGHLDLHELKHDGRSGRGREVA